MTAARLGEAFSTNPIELLRSNENEWLILAACAEVLRRDHEENKNVASDLPSV